MIASRWRIWLLVSFFLACTSACRTASQVSQAPPPADEIFPVKAPVSRLAEDTGRFLAGMPSQPGSPFSEMEAQEAWKEHQRLSDPEWNRVLTNWAPPMRQFQARELNSAQIRESVLFYPFSGPDTLMMTVFFPHNPNYVMVGLEPVGTLPDPLQVADKNLTEYLAAVRDTVDSELRRSFFVTREMDSEFRGQVTDGLFAPILMLLVRSGHTVLGYRYVRLDELGNLIDRPAGYTTKGRYANRGVQIDFRTDADNSVHKLFYFAVNLSDDRVKGNAAFQGFAAKLKGATTFLKATSYMLHRPEFAWIRDTILAESAAILQDDSGIPYKYLSASPWRLQLYGGYEKPYGSFGWLEQPDLRKAYEAGPRRELGFRIGYGFSRVPSNMQLALRATQPGGR